jgi:hypothetical protein
MAKKTWLEKKIATSRSKLKQSIKGLDLLQAFKKALTLWSIKYQFLKYV